MRKIYINLGVGYAIKTNLGMYLVDIDGLFPTKMIAQCELENLIHHVPEKYSDAKIVKLSLREVDENEPNYTTRIRDNY